ncbi:hypothetical protein THAOC_03890 [Thalassiosira oceanica]|uniref:Uncharacterized protein n=1 Tax=Thalassiosira oceanica TaxID=159749 RepID=K0TK96_THAOC|nr:hypothetical protein THAOC_03890 [Thalassiosira oceanica]|eukprot:EJK74431.1 hypothetical protein THAOC_03890 [Thalassiosira oceanica]
MEGIRLRRREADDTNPRIPAVDAIVDGKAGSGSDSAARIYDGRQRPAAAQLGGLDIAEAIMWGGPLSLPPGPEEASWFNVVCSIILIVAKRAFNGIRMPKESIYNGAGGLAPILGFPEIWCR